MFSSGPFISVLKQSRSQFTRSLSSRTFVHPWRTSVLTRSPFPTPHPGLRQFSATSRARVQYTRFSSSGHTHHRTTPADRGIKIIGFVTAAGAVYYVAHLEQVPETGRWRFMDISPTYEARLAQASYDTLLSEFEGNILPAHHPITRHVRRVVTDLLESSDLGTLHSSEPRRSSRGNDAAWSDDPFPASIPPDPESTPGGGGKQWHLLVVNDPKVVNAMASFGNIIVFTGILPTCKDEQGLAAVLGHEIAHAVARHASERYSYSKVLLFAAVLLQSAGLDLGLTRILNTLLLSLPNSRTQELEADTIGMRIASRACFDPQSAVEMHTRLALATEAHGVVPEFLRTHPGPKRRIQHLEELVPEANAIRAANPRCAGVRDSIEQFLAGMNRW